MGWIDKHGRPELVVHPDILAGKAVFRVADDQDPMPPAEPTPKQRDRQQVLDQLATEYRARTALENATGAQVEPARRRLDREHEKSERMKKKWVQRLAAEPPQRARTSSTKSGRQQKTGDDRPPNQG